MHLSQMPKNTARSALTYRKNARATTGQKQAVFSKFAPNSNALPANQNIQGNQIQYIDKLQMEYRSFIFNMTPNAVTDNNSQMNSQTLLGKSSRRRYLLIQNNSTNANIYLSFGNGETTGLSEYIIVPKNTSLELTSSPNNDVTIFAQDVSLIIPQPQAIVSVLIGSISE